MKLSLIKYVQNVQIQWRALGYMAERFIRHLVYCEVVATTFVHGVPIITQEIEHCLFLFPR